MDLAAPVSQTTSDDKNETDTKWKVFAIVCFAMGTIWRLLPLLNIEGRLLYQWPTEDGYYTLQIARNIALGLGMSVSEGTIPTNGTQPFWTYAWSVLYRLAGADKETGVFLVLCAEFLISCGAARLLYLLGRKYLSGRPNGNAIALTASAAWFVSPVSIEHTMNCLETGGYAFAQLVGLFTYLRLGSRPGAWSLKNAALLGVVLGWIFWVRNDGVFFILGICVAHWLVGVRRYGDAIWGASLKEVLVFGSVSVLVASPWLYSNITGFGYLMPISGVAESYEAKLGDNLISLPVPLLEYISILLPIPASISVKPPVAIGAALAVVFYLTLLVRYVRRTAPQLDVGVVAVVIYGSCLSLFYGLYFGADYFMGRYLFPLSTYFALVGATVFFTLKERLGDRLWGILVPVTLAGATVLALGLNLRLYMKGPHHQHRQVIEWVAENVPDDTWAAAIQTGTLGYFHDRTYNLDGKVSLEALKAKKERKIPQYVVDKDVKYMADWAGITSFKNIPPVSEHFEVVVNDEEKNLGVLKRIK